MTQKLRSIKVQKKNIAEVAVKSGQTEADQPRITIYYDGSCSLCSVEIRHYASCEGADRLRFVDVSKPDVGLGDDLTQQEAIGRFHVRRADGKLVSGARGFAELWGALPKWRWIARMASLPGLIPLLELVYRGFLPLRPTLSWIASTVGAKPINQGDKPT
jgi:predicted DCC family thiol-disulfide oxidoreductase YuxK